ncbi:MAG: hypothetical protein K5683_06055 [Prevotella sp.]|nr:hypothetical protein [Prevotella sp.]
MFLIFYHQLLMGMLFSSVEEVTKQSHMPSAGVLVVLLEDVLEDEEEHME